MFFVVTKCVVNLKNMIFTNNNYITYVTQWIGYTNS